ncbi:hypothetical protein STANM337S_06558 [Streptomyces tanashiensis]
MSRHMQANPARIYSYHREEHDTADMSQYHPPRRHLVTATATHLVVAGVVHPLAQRWRRTSQTVMRPPDPRHQGPGTGEATHQGRRELDFAYISYGNNNTIDALRVGYNSDHYYVRYIVDGSCVGLPGPPRPERSVSDCDRPIPGMTYVLTAPDVPGAALTDVTTPIRLREMTAANRSRQTVQVRFSSAPDRYLLAFKSGWCVSRSGRGSIDVSQSGCVSDLPEVQWAFDNGRISHRAANVEVYLQPERKFLNSTMIIATAPYTWGFESTAGDDDVGTPEPPARWNIGNVLVVGDSISNGYEGNHTWRQRLWEWTREEGLGATFVGPLSGTHNADEARAPEPPSVEPPAPADEPDPARFTGVYSANTSPQFLATGSRHYAMWGRQLGQSTRTIASVMNGLKGSGELPDTLLVELGFNDIGWLGAGSGLVPTMKEFVDNARSVNPHVRIVVGNVPQRTTLGSANPQLPQRTADCNRALAEAVPTWSTPDSPVALADIDAAYGCDPAGTTCPSTYDGLHPNAWGEYRIARAFGSTLHHAFGMGEQDPREPAAVVPFSIVTPGDLRFDGTQQGVTVTWSKILGAHSYDIQWRDTTNAPDAAWQPGGPTPANRFDLSWQFTGQPYEGHTYEVRVRAVAGDTGDRVSEWSAPVGGTAHPTTAAPPESVTVTPGAGAIDVSWTPSTGPYSDTITRYALWVYDLDTPLVWSTIRGYAPSARSARMEGLTPGHHYVAFVCAWNAAGEGKPRIPEAVVVR